MIVTLDVPDHVSFQLVYRAERREPFDVRPGPEWEFLVLDSAAQGLKHLGAIAGYCGKPGAAKAVAKLAAGRRSLYLVVQAGRTLSAGWCTVGLCKYYKVEPEAVVVGPIWTSEAARGKGLATAALKLAMNAQIGRGRTLFYIDTEKKNHSAQRVFEKCGFGTPVALYFR
jgi:GNAT superfamily N-acetyltransferase